MLRSRRVLLLVGALVALALGALAMVGVAARKPHPPVPVALDLPASPPVPATMFGMNQIDPAAWPAVPFGSLRLWDSGTMWSDLEPAPGQFVWTHLDELVAAAQAHGTRVLLTLGQTPSWASARPHDVSPYGGTTTPAEPARLEDWAAYVRAVVTRYRGRIEAYEPWNEPNLAMFFTGSPETLARLGRVAAAIVHQVDSAAKVVSPGIAWTSRGAEEWLRAYLSAGGAEGADVLGFHSYPREGWGPEQLGEVAQAFRRVCAEFSLTQPLWNTETGWGHTSPTDPRPWLVPDAEAPGLVARTYLALAAAGVQRLYWYGFTNRAVGLWLTGPDLRTLTEGGAAYAAVSSWLTGARPGAYGSRTATTGTSGGEYRSYELGYDALDGRRARAEVLWVQNGETTVAAPARTTEVRRLDGTSTRVSPGEPVLLTPGPILLVQR